MHQNAFDLIWVSVAILATMVAPVVLGIFAAMRER